MAIVSLSCVRSIEYVAQAFACQSRIPELAYLGGLPSLFVVAKDREVLKKIIYMLVKLVSIWTKVGYPFISEVVDSARRPADPVKYPVSEVKRQYSVLAASGRC